MQTSDALLDDVREFNLGFLEHLAELAGLDVAGTALEYEIPTQLVRSLPKLNDVQLRQVAGSSVCQFTIPSLKERASPTAVLNARWIAFQAAYLTDARSHAMQDADVGTLTFGFPPPILRSVLGMTIGEIQTRAAEGLVLRYTDPGIIETLVGAALAGNVPALQAALIQSNTSIVKKRSTRRG